MRRNGNLDVAGLGQVFTPPEIVTRMLALRENAGRVLEPSCGDGAFFKRIPACVGIEFDASVAPDGCVVMDFFDYPRSERFETVIGNPPYVRRRDVAASTAEKLPKGYDGRTNLSVFFMDKCLDHLLPGGELILIVPREFMKATSARPLNERLHAEGTFSHLVDLGDGRIFKGAAPNCVILRWVKGDSSHVRRDGAVQSLSDGLLVFRPPAAAPFSGPLLSEIFDVKVGAVAATTESSPTPRAASSKSSDPRPWTPVSPARWSPTRRRRTKSSSPSRSACCRGGSGGSRATIGGSGGVPSFFPTAPACMSTPRPVGRRPSSKTPVRLGMDPSWRSFRRSRACRNPIWPRWRTP